MGFKVHEIVFTLVVSILIVYITKPSTHLYEEMEETDHVIHVFVTGAHSEYESARRAIREKDGYACANAYADAIEANIRVDLYATLAPVVAAIRYAENGGAGKEYGILSKRVGPTYRSQAGWCAATVQKNWDRYLTAGGDSSDINAYIKYLGARYCPVGADNDPGGLNVHWVTNVTKFHNNITKE